jgi:cell wall-associated NlpC family hydrolase
MSGIAAVQSRVAEIRTAITAVSTPHAATATATALGSSGGAAGATGVAFADVLASALGGAQSTPGGSALATALGGQTPGTAGTLGGAKAVAATTAATAAPSGGGGGSALVDSAMKYLGVPYVWGGESASGLDCSGLVQRSLADLGVAVPRTARQQMKVGTEVPSLAQAQPGDLIVTRGGAHIAIYLGNNRIIHAPRPGEQVSTRQLFETDATIDTIRRVLPSTAQPAALPGGAGAVDPTRLALALTAGGLS